MGKWFCLKFFLFRSPGLVPEFFPPGASVTSSSMPPPF